MGTSTFLDEIKMMQKGACSRISILGCGWLGLPLAQCLVGDGFFINGSTTSAEKLNLLSNLGINAYQLNCNPALECHSTKEFFNSDCLFLNIPFRRDLEDPSFYEHQIDSVIEAVEKSSIRFVIFAGSTSIYPSYLENACETEEFQCEDSRAQILKNIEIKLLSSKCFKATVLRFAGLYGGSRKIGSFLSGKTVTRSADSPVNLVHLDDCLQIIRQVIVKQIYGEVLNVCSDVHPTRRNLYEQAALILGKEPPHFIEDASAIKKIVSNTKLKTLLDYQFLHPDPMKDLNI